MKSMTKEPKAAADECDPEGSRSSVRLKKLLLLEFNRINYYLCKK